MVAVLLLHAGVILGRPVHPLVVTSQGPCVCLWRYSTEHGDSGAVVLDQQLSPHTCLQAPTVCVCVLPAHCPNTLIHLLLFCLGVFPGRLALAGSHQTTISSSLTSDLHHHPGRGDPSQLS